MSNMVRIHAHAKMEFSNQIIFQQKNAVPCQVLCFLPHHSYVRKELIKFYDQRHIYILGIDTSHGHNTGAWCFSMVTHTDFKFPSAFNVKNSKIPEFSRRASTAYIWERETERGDKGIPPLECQIPFPICDTYLMPLSYLWSCCNFK